MSNHANFSSSPAFGTPVHPIPGSQRAPAPPVFRPQIAAVLPILLPPPTLRPLAFRVFTKKHNLTLGSSALLSLASFIGRQCGSGWREEGTGEKVLEEVAKIWKLENGPVIMEDGETLRMILKTLEACMSGGRIGPSKTNSLSRQTTFAFESDSPANLPDRPSLERQSSSFGLSGLHVNQDEDEDSKDPRRWLKVLSAFEQPRFAYDVGKKHFLPIYSKPRTFPSPSHKTSIYQDRFNTIHQRLLRNAAFQAPSLSAAQATLSKKQRNAKRTFYKITPIANLLGRGGSSHILLGTLVIAPTGTLALNDLSGSISLDLQHAESMQESEPYFCPGMIVLVDGVYEEDWTGAGSTGLGNDGGVGGTIGGRFVGFEIGGPPVERRDLSLGIDLKSDEIGGGFGWTDFLGQGSERAVGKRMRSLEQRLLGSDAARGTHRTVVILSDVTLDQPTTLAGLRKVLEEYSAAEEIPITFILTGNFCSKASIAGADTGSIEYKELFNELAAVLSDFPSLLQSSTWVFVPGDNDPWASSFSSGASPLIPREGVPEIFTSRIKRAFAAARSESGLSNKDELDGEAVWTSNPTRLSLFGPAHEIVIFRDDISGRLRRNAIRIGQATRQANRDEEDVTMSGATSSTEEHEVVDSPMETAAESFTVKEAKRLILSLLPQSTLSPFPMTVRPTHWDYTTSALSLYPLPHTLILADAETPPFTLTFEGCHVINPGRLVEGHGRRKKIQWVEYDCWTKRGALKESWIG